MNGFATSAGSTRSRHGWVKTIALCCIALAVAIAPPVAAAQVTYTYTGNMFNLFSCGGNPDLVSWSLCSTAGPNANTSYTTSDHVTATLTLDSALPANQLLTDVRNFSGFHLAMSDGEHTVTDAQQQGMFAEVATDASGQISQWRLVINTGYPDNGGVATVNFPASVHDNGTLLGVWPGNQGYIFSSPGTWASGAQSPATLTQNLINLVANPSLGLTQGQTSSLTDKLANALASIQAGENKQAINQLNAFIASVKTYQKNGKISGAAATLLIDAATNIINQLS